MANSCPLNFKPVDSNLSRLTSLVVVCLVLLYLGTHNVFILFFLTIDFIMKLFFFTKRSPLSFVAKILKNIFKLEENMVDGGAKRLAGFFGLFFVMLLILSHLFDVWTISVIIAVVFMLCSLLDVVINYCIGCKIYFIIKKIYPDFMENL